MLLHFLYLRGYFFCSAFLVHLFCNLLPTQYPCKDQRHYDRCVAFYNELGCMDIQFTPGDLFIRNSAGIRTIGSGTIADLAEITPEWYIMPSQVLVHHRHYAD